jgi:hypothetical protein
VTPVRRLLILAIVLLTGAGGYALGRMAFRPVQRITQPIAFNHKKHTGDLAIECVTCHQFVNEGRHAGLPLLSDCMTCHTDKVTDSPEEEKIRTMAAAGQDDVFRKLFRLPDHVYYSHRRHAGIAQIPCATCHAGIADTTRPPEKPLVRITMEFCIECHERGPVSVNCTGCHH